MDCFRALLEGADERGGLGGSSGEGCGLDEALKVAQPGCFGGSVVGGAEEEDAVGVGEDGVVVGDFGGGAGLGVGEGLVGVGGRVIWMQSGTCG